jgi:hypothetical protein
MRRKPVFAFFITTGFILVCCLYYQASGLTGKSFTAFSKANPK